MTYRFPPLPSLHALAAELRRLNAALEDGGDMAMMYCEGAGWPDAHWTVGFDYGPDDRWPGARHFELVPGPDSSFDATAVARRLLAAARDAGYR